MSLNFLSAVAVARAATRTGSPPPPPPASRRRPADHRLTISYVIVTASLVMLLAAGLIAMLR